MADLLEECRSFLDDTGLYFRSSILGLAITRFAEYEESRKHPSIRVNYGPEYKTLPAWVKIEFLQFWEEPLGKRFRLDHIIIGREKAPEQLRLAIEWLFGGPFPLREPQAQGG